MKRLLILHGWGSSAERWQEVKELLEKKGIEILTLDLPGFGKEPPPKEIWRACDYEKWVLDFIEKKGWPCSKASLAQDKQKFNLLGHSFGGGVAAMIAADCPEKIEKLILCAPAIIRKKKKGMKALIFYNLSKAGKKVFSLPVLKSFFPLAQRAIYRLCDSNDYYLASGIMKEIFKKVHSESLEEILSKIETKTLILWGKEDDAIPVFDIYKIKDGIENSKLEIFSGTGHNLHREMPKKLANEISKFLIHNS